MAIKSKKSETTTATPRARSTKASAKTAPVQQQAVSSQSSPRERQEKIARRAYSLWEERGRTHGSAEKDWFRAEMEVDKVDQA